MALKPLPRFVSDFFYSHDLIFFKFPFLNFSNPYGIVEDNSISPRFSNEFCRKVVNASSAALNKSRSSIYHGSSEFRHDQYIMSIAREKFEYSLQNSHFLRGGGRVHFSHLESTRRFNNYPGNLTSYGGNLVPPRIVTFPSLNLGAGAFHLETLHERFVRLRLINLNREGVVIPSSAGEVILQSLISPMGLFPFIFSSGVEQSTSLFFPLNLDLRIYNISRQNRPEFFDLLNYNNQYDFLQSFRSLAGFRSYLFFYPSRAFNIMPAFFNLISGDLLVSNSILSTTRIPSPYSIFRNLRFLLPVREYSSSQYSQGAPIS
jgi:hypothetical protein